MNRSKSISVLTCSQVPLATLQTLLERFGLTLVMVENGAPIPGSFWGDSEAGLIGTQVLVRSDTPIHSLLHEACHSICMDEQRRQQLHTDAGGEYEEENAVCYLQIVLADCLPEIGKERMWDDMDAWGYSFRLGNSRAWFEQDAEEARAWLIRYQLMDETACPTWQVRRI
jgi:hypothetical protein